MYYSARLSRQRWSPRFESLGNYAVFCSTLLNPEILTRKCLPYYLSREFSAVIVTDVYILPQTDTKMALKELHWTLCKLETIYPEAAFIVAGDFNKANLRTRWPKLYQHIDCTKCGGNTLDHCYSNFRDAYTALLRPPFGKSDPDASLLRLSYRQKLKQDVPVNRNIQRWSDQTDQRFKIVLIMRTGVRSGQPQRTTSIYKLTRWVSL